MQHSKGSHVLVHYRQVHNLTRTECLHHKALSSNCKLCSETDIRYIFIICCNNPWGCSITMQYTVYVLIAGRVCARLCLEDTHMLRRGHPRLWSVCVPTNAESSKIFTYASPHCTALHQTTRIACAQVTAGWISSLNPFCRAFVVIAD